MIQLSKRCRVEDASSGLVAPATESKTSPVGAIPIPGGDPLKSLLASSGGPASVQGLELESECLDAIRSAGIDLIVPLVGQGVFPSGRLTSLWLRSLAS